MKRTFKYYLKLTEQQKERINKNLDLCCWLHNYLLNQFKERDRKGEKQPTEYQLINSLPAIKKEYSELKKVHSSNLQEAVKVVVKNWQKYKELKKLDNKKKYPKYKPINRYNSLTYNEPIKRGGCGYKADNSPLTKKKETRELKISLGRQDSHNIQLKLKLVMERNWEGEPKTLTIKRKNNRYYAYFVNEVEQPQPLAKVGQNIGIDVNLNKQSFITLSNGIKYERPNYYKKAEQKLIKAQQELSKKQLGSKNREKAKLLYSKHWEKVVNQSKHYSYQVANELIKNYDGIAVEKLRIRNMVKNHNLAKSINDARWGILFKTISAKTEIVGRSFVRVNPANTSQKCSSCGELSKTKLKLSQRIFKCWNCENVLDRDINSAKNIYKLGFDRNPPLNGANIF